MALVVLAHAACVFKADNGSSFDLSSMTISSGSSYIYNSPTGKNFEANICKDISRSCYWGAGGSLAALFDPLFYRKCINKPPEF